MASFEQSFLASVHVLSSQGLRRQLPVASGAKQCRWLADFSHNDYLGLAQDAQITEAAFSLAKDYGMGATGSRLLSGNLVPHEQLESLIAYSKGTESALIFNSGYQANATVLAALLDAKVLGATPLVFADRLNHASLHHACQLMGVHQIRYRHNDLTHLERLLQQHADKKQPRFIVTETVFGMDGDQIDMSRLTTLADEYDAFLYLDEAHATGVLGHSGYGLSAGYLRCKAASDRGATHRGLAMGTFSKAVGASGAYIACSHTVQQYLLNRCSGFIYSTALSPAIVGAVMAAWERLPILDELRQTLLTNAQQLREKIQALGFATGTSNTHIIPIVVGEPAKAHSLKEWLLAQGLLTSLIRPPTVPPNTARIRIALSIKHETHQIEALLAALAAWPG